MTGNRKKFQGVTRASVIAASATLEGPWKHGSWMLSGRHTYIQPLARAMKFDLPYKFYDLQGKVNYDPGASERTSLSYYLGRDVLDWHHQGTNVNLSWGNQAWSTQWTHLFSPRLFSHFLLGRSRFDSKAVFSFTDFAFQMHNQIDDLSLKGSLSYAPSADHMVEFGGEAKFLDFDFQRETGENDQLHFHYSGGYGAGYLEDTWKFAPGWELHPGFRLDYYSQGNWVQAGPRLALNRQLNAISSVHLAYGRYAQFLNLVAQEGASFADMWFPVDRTVPPGIAQHFVAGYEVQPWEGIDFSVEGYYKPYENLVQFSEEYTRSLIDQNAQLSQLFNTGTGHSYGADVYIKNNFHGFDGWLGYSWGVSQRTIQGYNFGQEFYPDFDRRHQVVVMQDRALGKKWRLNLGFRFGTGQPLTLAVGRYTVHDINGRAYDVVLEGPENAFRLPPYHRLDVGFTRSFRMFGLDSEATLQVINVYNRKNVYIRTYDTSKNPAQYQDINQLPILPTIGLNVRF